MDFDNVMEWITKAFEAVGVAIIALGGAYALASAVLSRRAGRTFISDARSRFGQPLLLGLEVLIAADIIKTVTVDLSLESVLTLGVLVIVRVVLSFSLEIELDGMVPWRKAEYEREGSRERPSSRS